MSTEDFVVYRETKTKKEPAAPYIKNGTIKHPEKGNLLATEKSILSLCRNQCFGRLCVYILMQNTK